jgi:hypothetical protein
MKKNTWIAYVATGMIAFAFQASMQTSFVKGKVTPADKGLHALAVVNSDTLKAPIIDGAFEFKNVKAGTYTIIIETQAPYTTVQKKGVVVKDGETTDVGEIRLEPKQ